MRTTPVLISSLLFAIAASAPAVGADLRGEARKVTSSQLETLSKRYGSVPGNGARSLEDVGAPTAKLVGRVARHKAKDVGRLTKRYGSLPGNGTRSLKDDAAPKVRLVGRTRLHTAADVGRLTRRYGSLPGGIVLEGRALGLGKIKSITFDGQTGTLLLGPGLSYEPGVSPTTIAELARSIAGDDRIGVSITEDKIITYGAFSDDAELTRDLTIADAYLADFVIPPREWTIGYRMAGGFKTSPASQSDNVVVFYQFRDFAFDVRAGKVTLSGAEINLSVVPIIATPAKDGGYVPDLKSRAASSSIVRNANHISANISYYMRERIARRLLGCGEVAAIFRHLKQQGVDLTALADEIEAGLDKVAFVREWHSVEDAWKTYLLEIEAAGDHANWPAQPYLAFMKTRTGAQAASTN